MSWREREAARSPLVVKEHLRVDSWRRKVPAKKDLVCYAGVGSVTPLAVIPLPIGTKHAPPTPRETRPKMMAALVPDAPATHARTKLGEGALNMERRAVQGRNMLDKLRRRTSAPAQLEGVLEKGIPVGGF